MRTPEMPVEPADVAITDRRYTEAPEDEDRIHEMVKRANEYINARMETRAAPPADKSRPYREGRIV